LIDTYNMDPKFMLQLMENFGPIDWRHPAAHGAYWAALGTERAEEVRSRVDIDLINTYRQNIHSLQMLTRHGRLVFDPISMHIDMLPDPRFIPAYEHNLEMAKEAYERETGEAPDSY